MFQVWGSGGLRTLGFRLSVFGASRFVKGYSRV